MGNCCYLEMQEQQMPLFLGKLSCYLALQEKGALNKVLKQQTQKRKHWPKSRQLLSSTEVDTAHTAKNQQLTLSGEPFTGFFSLLNTEKSSTTSPASWVLWRIISPWCLRRSDTRLLYHFCSKNCHNLMHHLTCLFNWSSHWNYLQP